MSTAGSAGRLPAAARRAGEPPALLPIGAPSTNPVSVAAGVSPAGARSAPGWMLLAPPLRDASTATALLIGAIALGSGGFAHLDPALLGYLGATVAAWFAVVWRVSAFWRRPASAFYARALFTAMRSPRRLRSTLAAAGRDLATQDFIRRRSVARWAAHMLLSLGTLASFAITVPLVFGWMHFVPGGDRHYRMAVLTVPTLRFAVDGAIGWMFFHGLTLSAVAVVAGAVYFLAVRWRSRALPGTTDGFAVAPLILLLVVALTGLALPASRNWPAAFQAASVLHQAAVVVLLIALPYSKLAHVLIRPLQLGARAVRAPGTVRGTCTDCGVALAPVAQQRAVAGLLAQHGIDLDAHGLRCQACRRRTIAAAQAALIGARFQPFVSSPHPAALPGGEGTL